jgi:hypothetical protein
MGVDAQLYPGIPEQSHRAASRLSDVNAVSSRQGDVRSANPAAYNSVGNLTDFVTTATSAAPCSRPLTLSVTEPGGLGVPVQQKGNLPM